jgi:uncharacterized protein (TIGR02466 family)
MKRYDVDLFPTPLIVIKTDKENHNQIIEHYLPRVYGHKEETKNKHAINLDFNKSNYTSNTNGHTSFYTGSLLQLDLFKDLQIYIDRAIKLSLIEKEKNNDFDLRWLDFWYTIYSKGTNVEEHFHPNSIISGIFYLKCPENCGDIIFLDNNYNFKNFCVNTSPLKTFTYPKLFRLTPEEGMIILFPSWLNHTTDLNKSEEDRIMFSFNLLPTTYDSSKDKYGANSFFNNK